MSITLKILNFIRNKSQIILSEVVIWQQDTTVITNYIVLICEIFTFCIFTLNKVLNQFFFKCPCLSVTSDWSVLQLNLAMLFAWSSVLLVEENGKNHRAGFELTTLVVIGTDCTCSWKSNYHTIKMATRGVSDIDIARYDCIYNTFQHCSANLIAQKIIFS
jgi:hypothetical protein